VKAAVARVAIVALSPIKIPRVAQLGLEKDPTKLTVCWTEAAGRIDGAEEAEEVVVGKIGADAEVDF
jgi:hypothetical protein